MAYKIVFACSCSEGVFLTLFLFCESSPTWNHPYQTRLDPLQWEHQSFMTREAVCFLSLNSHQRGWICMTCSFWVAVLFTPSSEEDCVPLWWCIALPHFSQLPSPFAPFLLALLFSFRKMHPCWWFSLDQECTFQVTVPCISSYCRYCCADLFGLYRLNSFWREFKLEDVL